MLVSVRQAVIMRLSILLLFLALIISIKADHQTYPGTSGRPVLSDSEAENYTKEKYLQGWTPDTIQTSQVDYLVGNGGYSTIQEAINAAITDGGTTRKYIKIESGTYAAEVLIPKTTVPLTLYGTVGNPEDVKIVLTQPASMTGTEYANQVNPGGSVYKDGDPAYSMYNGCASKETIGTFCTSVFWAKNDDLQVAYLTIENPSKDAQAVAARSDGDRQQWEQVHFYGFQDTLLTSGTRTYFNQPIIKGDVDFIFGPATAVFENAEIIARADRPRTTAVMFAPNTDNSQKYGYLVINSKLTAEDAIENSKGCHLARSWDSTSTANGQVVIRETEISDMLNVDAPYDTAAGGRAYAGNANTNRDLDDSNYNRFWEYKNTGSGA